MLGVVVITRVEFQGHQVLVVKLSISRKGLRFGAVNAEPERLVKADCRFLLGHNS